MIVKKDRPRFMEEPPEDLEQEIKKKVGKRKIGEGILNPHFEDATFGICDIVVPKSGWDLFYYAFKWRAVECPTCNIWACDIGKLVCLNVFVEVDLMLALARCYDPNERQLKGFLITFFPC